MLNSQDNNINRCWACQKPRAKRKCKATNTFICSQCCGTKRKKEINCPDDCQYIISAKHHWIDKLPITPAQIDFWQSHFDIIHNIEYAMLQIKKTRYTDLKDIEIKEALENLIKTYETETRGIIYEYKSSNYRIQSVIDNIETIINQHRHINPTSNLQPSMVPKTNEVKLRKINLDEIIQSLKFLLGLTRQSVNKNIGNGYFDFLSLFASNTLVDETS